MKKRAVLAVAILSLALVAPLLAAQSNLVDDVIRMSQAGVPDATILAFVRAAADHPEATADDLIRMTAAGVSKAVILAMVGEAPAVVAPAPPATDAPATGAIASGDTPAPPADDPNDDGGCVTFAPPALAPDYGPLYPAWIWDPFWFLPRLDTRAGNSAASGTRTDVTHAPGLARPKLQEDRGSRPARQREPPTTGGRALGGGSRRR